MSRRRRLPPRPEYPDLPFGRHNCDDVATRATNAGWNALFKTDLLDFSYQSLAKEIGVTPAAIYRYFPTISALGAELARAACDTLLIELGRGDGYELEPPPLKPVREFLTTYLDFAERRPRHHALILSGQFTDHTRYPAMYRQRHRLVLTLKDLLSREIGREAETGEIHAFWATVHGSASIIAAEMPPQTEALLEATERYFDSLR